MTPRKYKKKQPEKHEKTGRGLRKKERKKVCKNIK